MQQHRPGDGTPRHDLLDRLASGAVTASAVTASHCSPIRMAQSPDPPFGKPPQGVSLDELAAAYAQAMGLRPPAARPPDEAQTPGVQSGVDSESSATQPPPGSEKIAAAAQPEQAAAEDSCPIDPLTILEALLFVGDPEGRGLTAAQAAQLMRGVEPDEVPELVDQLNRRYAEDGCPYEIVSRADGYHMVLRRQFYSIRELFYGKVRQTRLSQAAIDVLAIVAYRQPVTAEDVSKLRGKPSGHVLTQLVHRGLLRIDRPAGQRRTAHYRTTQRLLNLLGLKSLDDLPRSDDLGTL